MSYCRKVQIKYLFHVDTTLRNSRSCKTKSWRSWSTMPLLSAGSGACSSKCELISPALATNLWREVFKKRTIYPSPNFLFLTTFSIIHCLHYASIHQRHRAILCWHIIWSMRKHPEEFTVSFQTSSNRLLCSWPTSVRGSPWMEDYKL